MRAAHIVVGLVTALTLVGCDQSQESAPPRLSVGCRRASQRRSGRRAPALRPRTISICPRQRTRSTSRRPARRTTSIRPPSPLPKGLALAVRLDRSLSTARSRAGNAFHALLDSPLVVNGRTVLAGTRFSGHASPRLNHRTVCVDVRSWPSRLTRGHRRPALSHRNLGQHTAACARPSQPTFIGGGGGLGARLVGGPSRGLAIGTAVGAGAGTAVAASTGKSGR